MRILTTCRRCGAEFEPDPDAIRAGAWQVCRRCRASEAGPPSLPAEAEAKRLTPRPWWALDRTLRRARMGA